MGGVHDIGHLYECVLYLFVKACINHFACVYYSSTSFLTISHHLRLNKESLPLKQKLNHTLYMEYAWYMIHPKVCVRVAHARMMIILLLLKYY